LLLLSWFRACSVVDQSGPGFIPVPPKNTCSVSLRNLYTETVPLYGCWKDLVIRPHYGRNQTATLEVWNGSPRSRARRLRRYVFTTAAARDLACLRIGASLLHTYPWLNPSGLVPLQPNMALLIWLTSRPELITANKPADACEDVSCTCSNGVN